MSNMAINLLPTNQEQDKSTRKVLELLTRVTLAIGVVVILEGLVGVGLMFFFNNQLQKAHDLHDKTVSQISALESTEQSLVVVRDRLQKVQTVLSSRSSYSIFDKYDTIVSSLGPDESLGKMTITADGNKLAINLTNSDGLKSLIEEMSDSNKFGVSTINDLTFGLTQGFQVEFNAN